MTYAFVGHRDRPTRSLGFLPRVSNRKTALTAGFFLGSLLTFRLRNNSIPLSGIEPRPAQAAVDIATEAAKKGLLE